MKEELENIADDATKEYANENKLMFFETSALSSYQVTECFEDLLQEIYNERRKVGNKQKSNYQNLIKLAAKDKKIVDRTCC